MGNKKILEEIKNKIEEVAEPFTGKNSFVKYSKYSLYEVGSEENKKDVICYDISNRFAYFCTYTSDEKGITLNLKETIVYSLEEDNGAVESIFIPDFFVEDDK